MYASVYECLLNVVKSIHHECRIMSELGCFFLLSFYSCYAPFSLHICCIRQYEKREREKARIHAKLSVFKYTFATLLISNLGGSVQACVCVFLLRCRCRVYLHTLRLAINHCALHTMNINFYNF